MGGKASRSKGANSEREFAALLNEYGFTAHRTPMSGGMQWKGDLQHDVPGVHIEVKRQERLALPSWIRQAESDCPDGHQAVVAYRQSREPWRVVMNAHYWMQLLRPTD